MNCKFSNNCSGDCPKYSLCMYNSLQNQLSEINNQLTFILTALTQITQNVSIESERLTIVENNLTDLITTVVELTNDSETKHTTNKES